MSYGVDSGYDKKAWSAWGPETVVPGITFTSPTNPSNGAYSFVQLIAKDTATYTQGKNGTLSCPTIPGLDGVYPYPSQPPDYAHTWDAPAVPLELFDSKVSRTFKATMYLLWTSTIPGSIPVPIGSQKWYFTQASTTNQGYPTDKSWTTPIWNLIGEDGNPVDYVVSTPSLTPYGYPTWKGLATDAPVPNCPTDNTQEDEEQQ